MLKEYITQLMATKDTPLFIGSEYEKVRIHTYQGHISLPTELFVNLIKSEWNRDSVSTCGRCGEHTPIAKIGCLNTDKHSYINLCDDCFRKLQQKIEELFRNNKTVLISNYI